jgi:hypothetical protein
MSAFEDLKKRAQTTLTADEAKAKSWLVKPQDGIDRLRRLPGSRLHSGQGVRLKSLLLRNR